MNGIFEFSRQARVVLALCVSVIAVESASAKPNTTASCNKKYESCIDRCKARYGIEQSPNGTLKWSACVSRTCDKQFRTCLDNRGGKRDPGKEPIHPKGTGDRSPPTGGTKSDPKPPPGKTTDPRPPRPQGGGKAELPPRPDSGPILLRPASAAGAPSHGRGGRR